MKITIIGAGSTYTPELIEGLLLEADSLNLTNLYLYDIDQERLEIVGALVRRMVKGAGASFTVTLTADQREAVEKANFVLTQIRVGGQKARHLDTLICLQEDIIGQETTGPVGFAKAMRTIPEILSLCAVMREYAPKAWLINFTNPAGIVTEAVLKYGGVRAIGVCNAPIGIQMAIAKEYGVSYTDVDLDYVGLNHLAWVRKVFVKGEDKTEESMAKTPSLPANIPQLRIDPEFSSALAMRPNSYLDYFYLQAEMIAHLKSQKKTRAQVVEEIERALLEKYQDPNLTEKPAELEKRGGAHYSTVAVSLIKNILLNTGAKQIVNVQNNGALPELPFDAVIEVTALIDGRGATPFAIGKLEPEIRGLIQHVKAYEELTIEAAVHNDYDKALLALATNPLVTSVNKAKRILDKFNSEHKLNLQ